MRTTNPNPPALVPQADFDDITELISAARQRAVQAVNTTLIELYWQVDQTISRKIGQAQWGDGVVAQLGGHLARIQPGLRGFTRANLFRMRQFYEAYHDDEKSHHWRDNCPGRTTSSSSTRANGPKSASSTCARPSASSGASAS
ncbi:MAG: hypothetical protein I8H91_02415 [Burkholderiales bacterium]|nr:hypothetical protein [Burkholderiales bacterium]